MTSARARARSRSRGHLPAVPIRHSKKSTVRDFSVPEIELQVTPAREGSERSASEITAIYTRPVCIWLFLLFLSSLDLSLPFFPHRFGWWRRRATSSGCFFWVPSPPKKRPVESTLIDRFTAPEDAPLLRYTRHVFPFLSTVTADSRPATYLSSKVTRRRSRKNGRSKRFPPDD